MNELNEKAINMCQALIGFKPGVSDEEIDTAISTVTSLPMFAVLDKIELKKSLLAIYNVKVDTYQILEGRDARIPWLKEFKAERRSEWQFWTRYKKYLAEQKHFAPEVISQLDDLTDRILDKLFNPQRNDIVINKKGLVVGQVQSGKTANYTGLICKAADAGFTEAWNTIVDSNLTTLVAAFVLFYFGTGPVRGFAVTLSIGIATSMFTSVTVTRLIIASWLTKNKPTRLPI